MKPVKHGHIGLSMLGTAMLLAACGAKSSQLAAMTPNAGAHTPTSTLMAQATAPPLLTEVHLQAAFPIPEVVDGLETTHEQMRYLLWLPQAYWEQSDRRWPLIVYLHGAGDDDYDSTVVISSGLAKVLYLAQQPDDFPFVVISPQAFPGTAWWYDEDLAVLNALIGDVIERYRVDPDRVYLTGVSMGGYGSWFLATSYPERFAAMASVSGSGYRTPAVPGEDVLCRMADLPVWGIHGAMDRISEPEASEFFISALKASCGGEVKFTLYEDLGHMNTPHRIYQDPAFYAWLLEHSRGE